MVRLERAYIKDAEAITKIKIAAFNKEINTYLGRNGGPPGYDQVESEQDIIEHCITYKILLEQELIGAFFLYREGDNGMHFEDFVINPNYQGKGYGSQVMTLVEECHPEVKVWMLSTPIFSVGNQHLYKKCGYQEISRNEDEIFYQKNIQ